MNTLYNELTKLPGFKITSSHFKIGSKLHVSDFYYAKLCFQNSFYSSRFAFLLAKQILKDNEEDLDEIKRAGLTLIGYGLHSEFMLSLVYRFLIKAGMFDTNKLNYHIISDSVEVPLMKSDSFKPNIVIIVPIACTLSTSIKVEQLIVETARNSGRALTIRLPHYNLLHVSEPGDDNVCSDMEKAFGWVSKDPARKTITVKAFYGGYQRATRYFLKLPSKWSAIQYCQDCFPDETSDEFPHEELPLLETDRASLVPRIIFDYPKGKNIGTETSKREFILTPEMIKYQPGSSDGHFLYKIDLALFLNDNRVRVRDWLMTVKKSQEFKATFKEYSQVIIIAPSQANNTAFLLLVNEYLFSSAANIIHYDTENDYVQNFENLYGKDLRDSDCILYVNDSLSSGSLFFKMDELVRQARANGSGNGKQKSAIDMAIILVDQSPPIVFGAVADRLGGEQKLLAFAQFNLFTSLSLEDTSLSALYDRQYRRLINEALLDGPKLHFYDQLNKFARENEKNRILKTSNERHLLMLKATHNLYTYFSNSDARYLSKLKFDEFYREYSQQNWFSNAYLTSGSSSATLFNDEQAAVLKVLTHIPFTQYSPVLHLTFRWVIELLHAHRGNIQDKLNHKPCAFTFDDFNWLKFLIRRAGLLNINYLISSTFIDFLSVFFEKGIPLLIDIINREHTNNVPMAADDRIKEMYDKKRNEQVRMVRGFHIFFVAQIKYLLFENEQRSIILEKNILKSSGTSPAFRQLLRILQAENSVVIKRFHEMIKIRKDWKEIDVAADNIPHITDAKHPIRKFISQEDIRQHQHYNSLKLFFEETQQQKVPEDNHLFLNYLTVSHFLQGESRSSKTIIEKTKFIFGQIKQHLEISFGPGAVTQKTGVFLLIKDYYEDLTLVDELYEETPILEQYFWRNVNEKYLLEFLNGTSDPDVNYFKTITELYREDENGPWLDLYSTKEENKVTGLSIHFPEELNHLILIRLNKRNHSEDKGLGLLGIYFQKNSPDITDINRIRYLLLIREALISFVEAHHRNNEFLELQQASQTKRMVLLAGHGREMIMNLGAIYRNENDGIYYKIASDLGQLQYIMSLLQFAGGGQGHLAMLSGFYKIYHAQGDPQINDKFLEQLKRMIYDIFKYPEIEEDVPVDVEFNAEKIYFPFKAALLHLICFEILVNAKKNRWHFIKGAPAIENFTKNKVSVSLSVSHDQKLKLTIWNTGPKMDRKKLIPLNDESSQGKIPNLTSGTRLIKYLVSGILKDQIRFDVDDFGPPEHQVGIFKVEMTLSQMKDEEEKDFINRKSIQPV